MNDKIYPLNGAEAIFFPAFDKVLCKDDEISIQGGCMERLWDSLAFTGGSRFVIHWRGKVLVEDYDRFLAFLSFPKGALLSGKAVIDGKLRPLFEKEPGGEAPAELTGLLSEGTQKAQELTELFLELESVLEQNVVVLSWLGLSKSDVKAQAELADSIPRWNCAWDKDIRAGIPGRLEKNMILTREEGEALKEIICTEPSFREYFRANAEAAMKIPVKEEIREYAPVAPHMYRFVRVRDRERTVLEGPLLNLAVGGYLLEEPAYSCRAAEIILALLAMKWYEGPVCEMQGSQFHHVCFTEEHLLVEVSLAVGFLGGVLSEAALLRIAEKIEKEWLWVKKKCSEPGYRNYMNQGVVSNRGALIGAVFLQLLRGGYEEEIQAAYERHRRIVENYLTPAGHCAEGGAYFEYSFTSSILLWHVYAGFTGQPWEKIIPPFFSNAWKYQEAIMSVNAREGVRIPLNCGKAAQVNGLLLTFMTLICGYREGNNYLRARFTTKNAWQGTSFELLFYLLYRQKLDIHYYEKPQEEEISFPEEGLLSYRCESTKLLVTTERNPYSGHFHEDRGGIVLEAEGETLLPELGTTDYSNPLCLLMGKNKYHNLACPADLPMQVASEAGIHAAKEAAYPITKPLTAETMEIPEAKVKKHGKKGSAYTFTVETGLLYGDGIIGTRSGSLKENRLLLKDSWKFPEKHSLLITYLSYYPWTISRDKGTAESGRMRLRVESLQDWNFETEEGMTDYAGRLVYILRIRTQRSMKPEVISELTWDQCMPAPENTAARNTLALQRLLNKGGTIKIENPGIYEIEDTLYIKSHTGLYFGKGVFLKRSKSSIGSFAIINRGAFTRTYDTDITVEGLQLITGGVEARHQAAVYGLTGELSFFYVKRLRIRDFTCMDLPALSFGIHICTFEDIVLEDLHVEGRKDAVHLGCGSKFVIRHGLFRTFDDPIALNAHDYAVANPQMGWIENGLIEDCYDLADRDTTGYFCRILAGSWGDWHPGMEIQNSDTVVNGGRVYRAFQKPDGKKYISETPPVHAEGMAVQDGINWVMVQEQPLYNCGCRNLHFRDIHLQKKRDIALSIHFDQDQYSRSVYPGSVMPVQENITLENILVESEVGCLIRSITPTDKIWIKNSVLGKSIIHMETLPERKQEYGDCRILMSGNFCDSSLEEMLRCEDGRSVTLLRGAF